MRIIYEDDQRNTVTIEKRADGLFRIWGANVNTKWREWTITQREYPSITGFIAQFKILGDLLMGEIEPETKETNGTSKGT